MILDAAVVAFAQRGFHACRVSDIADEANVAYGLVYHYFRSKDEVLDTLFLDRWGSLLEFISETDALQIPGREKLHAIAAAIIDFYRYDPALMKVIIVEVMRSANTFGLRHSDKIAEAYVLIGEIVARRRTRARSSARSRRGSRRWRSTARSSRSSPAGSSACCRRARTSTRRRRPRSSRRSAAGSTR